MAMDVYWIIWLLEMLNTEKSSYIVDVLRVKVSFMRIQ